MKHPRWMADHEQSCLTDEEHPKSWQQLHKASNASETQKWQQNSRYKVSCNEEVQTTFTEHAFDVGIQESVSACGHWVSADCASIQLSIVFMCGMLMTHLVFFNLSQARNQTLSVSPMCIGELPLLKAIWSITGSSKCINHIMLQTKNTNIFSYAYCIPGLPACIECKDLGKQRTIPLAQFLDGWIGRQISAVFLFFCLSVLSDVPLWLIAKKKTFWFV